MSKLIIMAVTYDKNFDFQTWKNSGRNFLIGYISKIDGKQSSVSKGGNNLTIWSDKGTASISDFHYPLIFF